MSDNLEHLPVGCSLEICVEDQLIEDKHFKCLTSGLPVIMSDKLIIPYYPEEHIRKEYWSCYKHLIHIIRKSNVEKRCYPSTEQVIYPENKVGYVFRIVVKRHDREVTRQGDTSSKVTPRSFPPAGCDSGNSVPNVKERTSDNTSVDASQRSEVVTGQVSKAKKLKSNKASLNQPSATVSSVITVVGTGKSKTPPSSPSVGSNDSNIKQSEQTSTKTNENSFKKEIQSCTVKISCKNACKASKVLQGVKCIIPYESVEAINSHGRN